MAENGSSTAHQDVEAPKAPQKIPKLSRLVALISILSYVISLPMLAAGLWFICMRNYECEDLLRTPTLRIFVGMGLIILFMISNLVVFYGRRSLLPGLAIVIILLTIMLIVGLAFVGNYRVESRGMPASPMWLRSRIDDYSHWVRIKTCIFNAQICSDLDYQTMGLTELDFNIKKLSNVESGCCTPPAICGMKYVNATYWNPPKYDEHYPPYGGDCDMWSNNPNQLCYDCQTCREGFLRTINYRWRHLGVFLIVMSVFHIMAHVARFTVTMLEQSES